MTEADKTAEKLTASIRKTREDAAAKPAAASKATPKRATATPARKPAAKTEKPAASSDGYQFGRRVWPD